MTDTNALLPCPTPWCARKEEPYVWQGPSDLYIITCGSCQVEGPYCATENEANEAWNTRADTTQAARIAELEARNAVLERALTDVAVSLTAAISLLLKGGKAAKLAAPSGKMFDQMVLDYSASVDHARVALTESAK